VAKKKRIKHGVKVKISKPTPTWVTATLITVARHRDSEGHLVFEESTVERSWKMPDNYERIWNQERTDEAYQKRIKILLEQDHVVLKVTS
jgi:hypothetical protein